MRILASKQNFSGIMDPRKLIDLLRATIDPAQQKQAEEQLNQVRLLSLGKTCSDSSLQNQRHMWLLPVPNSFQIFAFFYFPKMVRSSGWPENCGTRVIHFQMIEFWHDWFSCSLSNPSFWSNINLFACYSYLWSSNWKNHVYFNDICRALCSYFDNFSVTQFLHKETHEEFSTIWTKAGYGSTTFCYSYNWYRVL